MARAAEQENKKRRHAASMSSFLVFQDFRDEGRKREGERGCTFYPFVKWFKHFTCKMSMALPRILQNTCYCCVRRQTSSQEITKNPAFSQITEISNLFIFLHSFKFSNFLLSQAFTCSKPKQASWQLKSTTRGVKLIVVNKCSQ